jgi:calreticulin
MVLIVLLVASARPTVYLEERFGDGWESRWKRPDFVRKGIQLGKVRVSAGNYYGDEKIQRGLETLEDRRHYLLYSNFSHVFDTRGRDLIVQFTVRLNIYLDCAGHYLKLFSSDVHPARFSNESGYSVMFGPDICGAIRRKTHIILGYNRTYFTYLRGLPCLKDHLTHGFTLIIRRNGTIEFQLDGEVIDQDLITNRFRIPKVSEIPDPSDQKPPDWDDDPYVADPDDTMPNEWVTEEFIPDPDAFRPPAWDDTIPWEAPMIRHPGYKGPWKPRTIPNTNYRGPWRPRMIRVAEPVADPTFGQFPDLAFLGLEFFQSASGTIFNNFLVTDDEQYAKQMLKEVFLDIRDAEVRAYDRLVGKITSEKDIEKNRDRHIKKMKDIDRFGDDLSDGEKEKETPDQKAARIRGAKRQMAKKRAQQKKFADFDSL